VPNKAYAIFPLPLTMPKTFPNLLENFCFDWQNLARSLAKVGNFLARPPHFVGQDKHNIMHIIMISSKDIAACHMAQIVL